MPVHIDQSFMLCMCVPAFFTVFPSILSSRYVTGLNLLLQCYCCCFSIKAFAKQTPGELHPPIRLCLARPYLSPTFLMVLICIICGCTSMCHCCVLHYLHCIGWSIWCLHLGSLIYIVSQAPYTRFWDVAWKIIPGFFIILINSLQLW